MNPLYLVPLNARYKKLANDEPGAMDEMVEHYRQYRSTSLLDLATVASMLAIDTLDDRALDPLALQAISDTNPNFDPNKLLGYSDDEWMGIANAAKGKYFEYLVVDKLNSGEAVGDIVLPDGFSARLAESKTQPGWDIQIVDDHGQINEWLQLKATESTGYIRSALQTYPDITILATSEVAHDLPGERMVLDSGVSERRIEEVIGASLDDSGAGFWDHFWDAFHPIVPLLMIAGTQGYRVAVGKQSVVSAAVVGRARATRALTSAGVGALIKGIGGGWLAVPAAIFTGWIFDRAQNIDDLVNSIRKRNVMLALRRDYYAALVARSS